MVVVVLTAVPPGLRGHLTRWLLEIAPGVYVGRVNRRIRDHLWGIIISMLTKGRAIMVSTARSEQGLDFRVHGHEWTPVDLDGLTLMSRPNADAPAPRQGPAKSNARRYREARKFTR
ncbi:MAG TPA: type I-E CRISPR-associated endoribonuclease Cas2e [Actinomycetaceae bacterium]|nr:type I-E CRISPR-associated endoribonuclease Cas2e [Actinomycetaceae bacterium]